LGKVIGAKSRRLQRKEEAFKKGRPTKEVDEPKPRVNSKSIGGVAWAEGARFKRGYLLGKEIKSLMTVLST